MGHSRVRNSVFELLFVLRIGELLQSKCQVRFVVSRRPTCDFFVQRCTHVPAVSCVTASGPTSVTMQQRASGTHLTRSSFGMNMSRNPNLRATLHSSIALFARGKFAKVVSCLRVVRILGCVQEIPMRVGLDTY